MEWIGNISKWALWMVETLIWESNCFVARGGCGVEHVVSRAAICLEHMLLMLLMLVAAQVCAWLRIWM